MSIDVKYYRIWLGNDHPCNKRFYVENFIGADVIREIDLSDYLSLPEAEFHAALERQFRKEDKALQLRKGVKYEEPSPASVKKVLATMYCLCAQIKLRDIVVGLDRFGNHIFGEVVRGYHFAKGDDMPHKLEVKWLTKLLDREKLGEDLWKSIHRPGTLTELRGHAERIEDLIAHNRRVDSAPDPFFGASPTASLSIEANFFRAPPVNDETLRRKFYAEGFVGTDFICEIDLTGYLKLDRKIFQAKMKHQFRKEDRAWQKRRVSRPVVRKYNYVKRCLSFMQRFCWSSRKGTIVVCPDRRGNYIIGIVVRRCYFAEGEVPSHRVGVRWLTRVLTDKDLSEALREFIHEPRPKLSLEDFKEEICHLIINNQVESPDPDANFGCAAADGEQEPGSCA